MYKHLNNQCSRTILWYQKITDGIDDLCGRDYKFIDGGKNDLLHLPLWHKYLSLLVCLTFWPGVILDVLVNHNNSDFS